MRQVLSILVLTWVFVLAPGFCLGAIGTHDCGCGEAGCHDCQPQPGEAPHSHGCHDDPCPKDVCRTEPDVLTEVKLSAGTAGTVEIVATFMPAALTDNLDLGGPCKPHSDPPPRLLWADLFALNGLPLLI
jgi:hypothetical protein